MDVTEVYFIEDLQLNGLNLVAGFGRREMFNCVGVWVFLQKKIL